MLLFPEKPEQVPRNAIVQKVETEAKCSRKTKKPKSKTLEKVKNPKVERSLENRKNKEVEKQQTTKQNTNVGDNSKNQKIVASSKISFLIFFVAEEKCF